MKTPEKIYAAIDDYYYNYYKRIGDLTFYNYGIIPTFASDIDRIYTIAKANNYYDFEELKAEIIRLYDALLIVIRAEYDAC